MIFLAVKQKWRLITVSISLGCDKEISLGCWLKQGRLFCLSFRGWQIQDQGPSGFHVWWELSSWLLVLTWPFLWGRGSSRSRGRRERELSPFFFFFIKPPILLDQGPTLTPSFNLNYLLKALFPNSVTWGWGSSFHICIWGSLLSP